ncbi:MAG: hypothetical protein IT464_12590 [Planctomycetes bacterium]|nr:hypothetical protein [Planctomycetota bacterium]
MDALGWLDCTGDVCTGDVVTFRESVWGGTLRKPVKLGERVITAYVARDSYGRAKQQHTFTLHVIHVSGDCCADVPAVTTRKGRNMYRFGTARLAWAREAARGDALGEKHARGNAARAQRDARRATQGAF